MQKLIGANVFPGMMPGFYYVFEDFIVFLLKDNIYAAPNTREGGQNIVDTFELKYQYLNLSYASLIDLKGWKIEDFLKFRKILKTHKESLRKVGFIKKIYIRFFSKTYPQVRYLQKV